MVLASNVATTINIVLKVDDNYLDMVTIVKKDFLYTHWPSAWYRLCSKITTLLILLTIKNVRFTALQMILLPKLVDWHQKFRRSHSGAIKCKSLPVLLYRLEVSALDKRTLRSLAFSFSRFLMKLFKISNTKIAKACQETFQCQLTTAQLIDRLQFVASYFIVGSVF